MSAGHGLFLDQIDLSVSFLKKKKYVKGNGTISCVFVSIRVF